MFERGAWTPSLFVYAPCTARGLRDLKKGVAMSRFTMERAMRAEDMVVVGVEMDACSLLPVTFRVSGLAGHLLASVFVFVFFFPISCQSATLLFCYYTYLFLSAFSSFPMMFDVSGRYALNIYSYQQHILSIRVGLKLCFSQIRASYTRHSDPLLIISCPHNRFLEHLC